jgi:hypothetical protein
LRKTRKLSLKDQQFNTWVLNDNPTALHTRSGHHYTKIVKQQLAPNERMPSTTSIVTKKTQTTKPVLLIERQVSNQHNVQPHNRSSKRQRPPDAAPFDPDNPFQHLLKLKFTEQQHKRRITQQPEINHHNTQPQSNQSEPNTTQFSSQIPMVDTQNLEPNPIIILPIVKSPTDTSQIHASITNPAAPTDPTKPPIMTDGGSIHSSDESAPSV